MKHKKWKLLLSAILTAGIISSMAACSSNEPPASNFTESGNNQTVAEQTKEEVPEKPDPMKITFLVNSANENTETEEYKELVQYINEYTNMDVAYEFDGSDNYSEKLVLKYASNEFDTVTVIPSVDANFIKACADGLFWDITDYIDDYSNLAAIPELVRVNASVDGSLYGIPRYRNYARNGLGYRLDWLDKFGLKEPTTLEEFYNMLYAFTYDDPDGNSIDDTYGLIVTEYPSPWNIMQLWFGAPNGWGIDENGDLIPAHMTKEYDAALDWFREIYSLGLINPDFRETSSDEWDTLLRSGVGGCSLDTFGRFRRNQQYFESNSINAETGLAGSMDAGYGFRCLPNDGYGGVLAISKRVVTTEEDLKRVLSYLDALNDGEVINRIDVGIEGLEYTLTKEGYYHMYTAEEKEALGITVGQYRSGFNQILAYFSSPEEEGKKLVQEPEEGIKGLETAVSLANEQYVVPNYATPYLKLSQTYITNGAPLDEMINNARLDYITGMIDKAGLDAVKEQWLKAGGQAVIDEVNTSYHAAND